ncbi:hypothetical protein WS72_25705 [Burkholderia savannae]|uniref:Uncharacterized protein n=1 Tax=Burkholderia savannae TaxID=1637837 RepID=A0ABR5T8W8_9BURK|nr:hypothetical protein WS91_06795 [Burkholderia sp. MSMB1498]KWZ38267.1 hypothetical protein WS72_25705 [Burkholderia savannae]
MGSRATRAFACRGEIARLSTGLRSFVLCARVCACYQGRIRHEARGFNTRAAANSHGVGKERSHRFASRTGGIDDIRRCRTANDLASRFAKRPD